MRDVPGSRRGARLHRDEAERLAIAALGFLAETPEVLAGFLAATGLGPETLRAAAARPEFLVSVLEHLLADESLLLVFAERERVRPTAIMAARHALDPLSELP